MQKILIALLFLGMSQAHALTFTCNETAQSKKENANNVQLKIEVQSPEKIEVTSLPLSEGQAIKAIAHLDDHDSYKDLDDQGYNSYNLDEDYDRKAEARFVSNNSDLAVSDGDSIVFVERTLLQGKPGKVSLSSGQANDGESGSAWLWARGGQFDCFPQ